MIKQLSSLDLHFLLKELYVLKESRIDKIYQPTKNTIIFSFYKTNVGKKLLQINVGQCLFIADERKEAEDTLGFGMFLRKHLEGYSIFDINQLEPERILKLSFKAKYDKKFLYLEFFGKGNAILCSEHDVIMNALEHHEFRERVVKPKLKYVYPIMNYNIFNLEEKDLINMFRNSKKDSLVTSLATELGLGGLYSEEACLLSTINKNQNPKNIDHKQINSILISIKKIIDKKINPEVILKENKPIDAAPFELEFYKDYEKKLFKTFSEALSFFYSQFEEVKETAYDRKMKELQRIVEQQQQTINRLKEEGIELREKGELIYHKYNLIKEIIEEINKASKKYSWKEIKEKLQGHVAIKEVNEKDRKVILEL